jgi:predicted phosphate transport protein (TIGR00153 family)
MPGGLAERTAEDISPIVPLGRGEKRDITAPLHADDLEARGKGGSKNMVHVPFFSINKRESDIVDGIQRHIAIVKQAVDNFANLVGAVARGATSDSALYFEGVIACEKEADEVHRMLSTEIAEGAFFGGVREDILELLEMIDNIADSAKDASRFLETQWRLDAFALSLLRSEQMTQFVANLRKAVYSLGELVAAFKSSRKEVLAKVHDVEDLEEAADSNKDQLIRQLFQSAEHPDPITVIQMRDFMFVADDIADNAEDASDVVLVLLAKGYG